MANASRRLPTNVDGDFFVDDTCIDCATCRWVAPKTFDEAAGASRVFRQPITDDDAQRALMAAIACPTASIGFGKGRDAKAARDAFPDRWVTTGPREQDGVYHCGFHAESSFGAASYLIVREGDRVRGNVLVDSPRYSKPLARRIEALGGVALMFLTHRDDVADHERWAEHFGCERVMHKDDVSHRTRDVERQLDGHDDVALDDDLVVIPTPGHTRGSACLLHRDVLLSGDHLAFNPALGHLYAFRGACWYSWDEVVRSTQHLFEHHRFRAVLPGHSHPIVADDVQAMESMKVRCLRWMGVDA